jgi:hypothetical protein
VAAPYRYACPVCGGTGKSPVPFDATTGFMGAGISDLPVCARCYGSGFVPEKPTQRPDSFDYLGAWLRKLIGALRR